MPYESESVSSTGIRVLIFEESFPVARSLGGLLQAYGFHISGMAASADAALKLIAGRAYDVAVINIGLNYDDALQVADAVHEAQGRMVYLIGYGDPEPLPAKLQGYPSLDKPADPRALVTTILEVAGYAWGS